MPSLTSLVPLASRGLRFIGSHVNPIVDVVSAIPRVGFRGEREALMRANRHLNSQESLMRINRVLRKSENIRNKIEQRIGGRTNNLIHRPQPMESRFMPGVHPRPHNFEGIQSSHQVNLEKIVGPKSPTGSNVAGKMHFNPLKKVEQRVPFKQPNTPLEKSTINMEKELDDVLKPSKINELERAKKVGTWGKIKKHLDNFTTVGFAGITAYELYNILNGNNGEDNNQNQFDSGGFDNFDKGGFDNWDFGLGNENIPYQDYDEYLPFDNNGNRGWQGLLPDSWLDPTSDIENGALIPTDDGYYYDQGTGGYYYQDPDTGNLVNAETGESYVPKQTKLILTLGVFFVLGIIGYYIYKKRKKKAK